MEKKKILIVYSSGYATTREIAARIYHILAAEPQLIVHLKKIDSEIEINNYDDIVLGTSVRADQLPANTVDFLTRNKEKLLSKKIALFIVCLKASSASGQKLVMETFTDKLSRQFPSLDLNSITAFGGKIDLKKLNTVMQGLMKQVYQNSNIKSFGNVDARDWDKISEWAFELKKKLVY